MIKHKFTPSIRVNYHPFLQDNYDDQYYDFKGQLRDKLSKTSVRSLDDKSKTFYTIILNNHFQAKRWIKDNNGELSEDLYEKIDLLFYVWGKK